MNLLEILYVDEDHILVNPHRDQVVRELFKHSDAKAKAVSRLAKRIDDKSNIVSVSVKVNYSYLSLDQV